MNRFVKTCLMIGAILTAFMASSTASSDAQFDDTRISEYESLLRKHDIEPSSIGINKFIDTLAVDPEYHKRIQELVAQLGHKEFALREAASKELCRLEDVPNEILLKAADSPQPEIRKRIAVIAESRSKLAVERSARRSELLIAVFKVIEVRKLKLPIERLLFAYEILDQEIVAKGILLNAIQKVATPSDLTTLRQKLKSEDSELLIALVETITKFASSESVEILNSVANRSESKVTISAMHGLLELGDQRYLKNLVSQLNSENSVVRAGSLKILRSYSGQDFGFNPFSNLSETKTKLEKWKAWLASKGKLLPATQPIKRTTIKLIPLKESLVDGLIAHFSMDTIGARLLNSVQPKEKIRRKLEGRLRRVIMETKGPDSSAAIQFIGSGSEGNSGGHADLPFIDFNKLDAFTVGLWVKHQGLTNKHGEAFIAYGFDQASTFEGSLCIGTFFDEIHFRTGKGRLSIPHLKMDHEKWVHYAMSFSEGHLQVFKNGKLEKRGAAAVEVKGTKAALARHWWANGAISSTRFIGCIDDVRIYDRSLDEEQIQWLVSETGK